MGQKYSIPVNVQYDVGVPICFMSSTGLCQQSDGFSGSQTVEISNEACGHPLTGLTVAQASNPYTGNLSGYPAALPSGGLAAVKSITLVQGTSGGTPCWCLEIVYNT